MRAVAAFALRRVPAAADADDVVSETFLVAWRRFGEAPADLRPWLFGVARHVLQAPLPGGPAARRAERPAGRAALGAPTPARPITAGSSMPCAELSETDRDVLTLTAWEGLSHAETGDVLGCSAAAVAVRLHRARRRLETLRPATARPILQGATHEP